MGRKKLLLKRRIAMLLCVANILGQVVPSMAQEAVTVSDNSILSQESAVQEPDGVSDNLNLLKEEGIKVPLTVSDNAVLSEEDDEQESVSGQDLTANVALGKRAVASSQEADTVKADYAVDGDNAGDNSRWGSARGEGSHWIYIDLGQEQEIRTVAVFWENRKATSYKIQIADSLSNPMAEEDWQTVKECKTRPASITDVIELDQSHRGRYVRLYIESFTAQDPDGRVEWDTVSVYEIEIYGSKVDIQIQNPSINVAKGKTAVSSSQENDDFIASEAVDGDQTVSRWSSARGEGPEWIYVDLGKSMDVKSFRIFWETRKATNYKIQIAQNLSENPREEDWTTVQSFTQRPGNKLQIITLNTIKRARYVRLYIEDFDALNPDNNESWNTISIYELEVYGGNAPGDIMETDSISVVQPQPGDRKLQLNLSPREGATVKYNGTDYEQLIDDELNIYQPIIDREAIVSVKITNDNNPSEYVFKEMQVTIPGQYTVEEGDNPAPKVLPELREWKGGSGIYTISEETRVVYKEEELKTAAQALARDYQSMTGKTIQVIKADKANEGDIFFCLTEGKGLFKEGYLMNITNGIVIEAEESTGAYWATRTILQSIKSEGSIPRGIARDYPMYEVRGLILDVGRKTFSMDYLKQTVQELAWYKMNDFQIHLNDNYIWLEEYSQNHEDPMTAYSGFRLESDIKKGGNNGLNQADLTNTDVFYTKDEFRELMQTAKECGVNIVPEIDVPAHSLALTKVRPDLRDGTYGRENDHLALSTKFEQCVEFVQSIFNEYMGSDLENPVFDEEATIHIGCDEYEADAGAFRRFCNSMIEYVQGNGRKVRFWGSLTRLQADVDVISEDVQVNLWSKDWARMDQMYEEGYEMINCLDTDYYIVPNAGYYKDYLENGKLYNLAINTNSGVTIPAGDAQMLGGAFAIWNDMTDKRNNGVSEYDVYDRMKTPIALFGAKLWGKEDLTLEQAVNLSNELGSAPGTNFGYHVQEKEGVIAHYPMEEQENLLLSSRAEITETDGKSALLLQGNESYAKTNLVTVGLENDLRVKVKRVSGGNKEQILFESPYGSIKAVQKDTGKVGFSRENYDYSFNYTLPVNEWVELEFKNHQNVVQLYVNGTLVDTIGDNEQVEGRPLLATMMFPVEYIGSKTKAFVGYVDDVRIGKEAVYYSTMELDKALMVADICLSVSENSLLSQLVTQGKEIVNSFAPSEEDIAELTALIQTEVNKIELGKADYSEVDYYLNKASVDLSPYTKESVDRLENVINSIVRDLPKDKQNQVDGYAISLAWALEYLELTDISFIQAIEIEGVTASSYQQEAGEVPENVIDNNPATMWHTQYNKTGEGDRPHWIQFEFKEEQTLKSLRYLPRTSGNENGIITAYEIKTSVDGTNFEQVVASGEWSLDKTEKTVIFNQPVATKYLRLVITASHENHGAASEITLEKEILNTDREGLNALIDKAKALDSSLYSKESWDKLQEKVQEAEGLLQKENASAQEIELMKQQLTYRIATLRLQTTPWEEEDPKEEDPKQEEVEGKVWVTGIYDPIYNGKKQTFPIQVYDGTKLLTEKKDYTITFKNNQKVYTLEEQGVEKNGRKEFNKKAPQIILKMKGNYKGSKTLYFQILPKNLSDSDIVSQDIYLEKKTGKTNQKVTPVIYFEGKKLTTKEYTVTPETVDITQKTETPVEVVIKGKGNFTGELKINLRVGEKNSDFDLSKMKATIKDKVKAKISWEELQANSFSIQEQDLKVMNGSQLLTLNKEYQIAGYENHKKVGTATVILEGNSDMGYHGKKRITYQITGKDIKEYDTSVEKGQLIYPYEDKEILLLEEKGVELVHKVTGEKLTLKKDFDVSYIKNKEKGTATMTVAGNPENGYTGTKKFTFKITQAVLQQTDVVFAENRQNTLETEYMKGGAKPEVTVSVNGKVLEAGKDYDVSYSKNKGVTQSATALVKIKGKGNYTGKAELSFSILKKSMSDGVSVVAADKTVSEKAGGFVQKFKVYDSDQKILGTGDYDKNSVSYYLVDQITDKVSDTPLDIKKDKVPAGSIIEIRVKAKAGGAYDKEEGAVATGRYRIVQYDISKARITIAPRNYEGKPVLLHEDREHFTVAKVGTNDMFVEGKPQFEIMEDSYVKNDRKGTAKVTIRGIGSFGGTKTVTFKIVEKDITKEVNWLEGIINRLLGQ